MSCPHSDPPIVAFRLHLSSACNSAVLVTQSPCCVALCVPPQRSVSSHGRWSIHLPRACTAHRQLYVSSTSCASTGAIPRARRRVITASRAHRQLSRRPARSRRCSLHPPDHCRRFVHRSRSMALCASLPHTLDNSTESTCDERAARICRGEQCERFCTRPAALRSGCLRDFD